MVNVFLVSRALRYLWDIQAAHEAIADFHSLGAVFPGSLDFMDNGFLHKIESSGAVKAPISRNFRTALKKRRWFYSALSASELMIHRFFRAASLWRM